MAAPHLAKWEDNAVRLDVWLFRTRLLKSRSLATKMILNKKIRISRNGETSRHFKPHVTIRPGDHVTFMRGEALIHVEMVKPGERRGPAKEAQTLYKVLPTDMSSGESAG